MKTSGWSIGVYTGSSPFQLSAPANVRNPVFTARRVMDMDVNIVAHPFMFIEGSVHYLFFTAKSDTGKAPAYSGIGCAQSKDGIAWEYKQIVLKEPFVLAHPQVFRWQDEYYMIPEAHTETTLRLYRATEFPLKWTYESDLLSGEPFISAVVVRHSGIWWTFVARSGNSTLRLFHSADLKGRRNEHPLSPIVVHNPHIARPGGPPFVVDGVLYRTGQDCHPTYGRQVFAFRVDTINPTSYKEEMVTCPLVAATSTGWNADAMHHVDLHQVGAGNWLAAVDACGIVEN
jgi:hypothetical protein